MSPQRQNTKLEIGDQVHLVRCPEFRGEITEGPILNGKGWMVQWEGLMESEEFAVDLVKIK